MPPSDIAGARGRCWRKRLPLGRLGSQAVATGCTSPIVSAAASSRQRTYLAFTVATGVAWGRMERKNGMGQHGQE